MSRTARPGAVPAARACGRGGGAWILLAAAALLLGIPLLAFGDPPAPLERYMVEKKPGRHALVMGNRRYQTLMPIPSAEPDAREVTRVLKELGFEVTNVPGGIASYSHFEDDVLPAFRKKLEEGDLVLLYFSGHGFGYGSDSYLVPTVFKVPVDENVLNTVAIPVSALEDYVAARRPGFLVIVFDACRTVAGFVNRAKNDAGIPKGPPTERVHLVNTIVAYATRADEPASGRDSDEEMSTFTRALVEHLKEEGVAFSSIFKHVSADVLAVSKEDQQPGLHDWSVSDLILRPSPADLQREREAWIDALTSNNPRDAVDRYLRMFALSRYAADARAWRAENADKPNLGGLTLVSPAAVERAWEKGGGAPVSLQRSASAFAFGRSLDGEAAIAAAALPDAALGVIEPGAAPLGRAFPLSTAAAETVNSLGDIVTVKDLVARSRPHGSARVVKHLPRGTRLRIAGVNDMAADGLWAAVKVEGSEDRVYVPVSVPRKALSPAVLGRRVREVTIRRLEGGSGYLVDASAVERVMEGLRAAKVTITWVSMAAAPAADPEEADRQAAALVHLEHVLKRSGVQGRRITSVQGAEGVAAGEIRLRFFGF